MFNGSGMLEYTNPAFLQIYRLEDCSLPCHAQEIEVLLRPICGSKILAKRCVSFSDLPATSYEQWLVDLCDGRRIQVVHQLLPTGGWLSRHTVARNDGEAAPSSELLSLQALIDQVPDYLWVKDTTSRFVVANLALAKDHGFSRSGDLIGLSDLDLHAADTAIAFRLRESDILMSGEPMIDQEEAVIDASGQEKWLSSSKMPLRNNVGQIVGLLGVARDITHQKKAEDLGRRTSELEEMSNQLTAALERERQVNALQSQFVSMASHEFRTPLAIIDGAAQRLTRRQDQLDATFVAGSKFASPSVVWSS